MVTKESQDYWEEELLLKSLHDICQTAPQNGLNVVNSQAWNAIKTYFENLAIREDTSITSELYDAVSLVSNAIRTGYENIKPLETIKRNKIIAKTIDYLVINGAPQTQAITAIEEWKNMGDETLKKIAQKYCCVKVKDRGNTNKQGIFFANDEFISYATENINQFPNKHPKTYRAFQLLQADISKQLKLFQDINSNPQLVKKNYQEKSQ